MCLLEAIHLPLAGDFVSYYLSRFQITKLLAFAALGWVAGTRTCTADELSYTRDIRPILSANCFACHGPDEQARQAELRLDTRAGATADLGGHQAIVPGDAAASELIRRITSDDPDTRMPPAESNKHLQPEQIEKLRQWVAAGAEYQLHWAFVPPQRPAVPNTELLADEALRRWPRNEIDHFVLARLADNQRAPSLEADRYTLVRRVHLDLIGLPPTVEQADAFVHDDDPQAYENLVDRLLQSERYGERWARKWLDLARYADTNGYEKDRPRNIWPYRDWVIRALNADLPFDQFTIEQLAGDMLPNPTPDQLTATGFHRNTMLNEEGGIDPLEFRFHAMTDRVATTGTTWLGLTIGCAQCHSHKYDPVTHTDYYGLLALLNNADEPDLDLTSAESETERQRRLAEAEKLLAALPDQWPLPAGQSTAEQRRAALEQAFAGWLQRERERTVAWIELRPAEAKSNLPLLTVQDDNSVLASGDISKDDTYELTFADPPRGVTALRLEALPDDSLPAHGPGLTYYEGPKGDFFLGEFQLFDGDRKLAFARASESYAKNNFGANPVSAALATDGDPQTGWSCAGRFGEAHQAVFVLAEPWGPEAGTAAGALKVKLRFGRHYACSLGRFRISVTTDPRGGEARDLPREIESLLTVSAADVSAEQLVKLREQFLLSAPELAKQAQQIRDLRKPPEAITTLVFRERPAENPRPTFRHHRGEYLQPREPMTAHVPAFLPGLPADQPANRLALARWLVSRDNPLTARVVVNRQWAAFFGQGLVRTTGDFGFQGEAPTHAELLDWLAVQFMDDGWSLKRLHRLIVTSATYRQSARKPQAGAADSAVNFPLSAFPRQRIDAELVRDATLHAAGLLSHKMYGPPVRPPQPEGVTEVAYGGAAWQVSTGEDRYRRGLYTFIKRTAPYAMFNTFDGPSGEVCIAQRDTSNTPLQSLTLLNDGVVVEAAQALGKSAVAQNLADDQRIVFLFRRCLTRPPRDAETSRLLEFVQQQRVRLQRGELKAAEVAGAQTDSAPGNVADIALWTIVARAILNLDEMITRS